MVILNEPFLGIGATTRAFEKFVDSPYCSESELCGMWWWSLFSEYLPWQAMHFLQYSTHFSKM